jgi:hypothetical protein
VTSTALHLTSFFESSRCAGKCFNSRKQFLISSELFCNPYACLSEVGNLLISQSFSNMHLQYMKQLPYIKRCRHPSKQDNYLQFSCFCYAGYSLHAFYRDLTYSPSQISIELAILPILQDPSSCTHSLKFSWGNEVLEARKESEMCVRMCARIGVERIWGPKKPT